VSGDAGRGASYLFASSTFEETAMTRFYEIGLLLTLMFLFFVIAVTSAPV
jgi:hypothetical protein